MIHRRVCPTLKYLHQGVQTYGQLSTLSVHQCVPHLTTYIRVFLLHQLKELYKVRTSKVCDGLESCEQTSLRDLLEVSLTYELYTRHVVVMTHYTILGII